MLLINLMVRETFTHETNGCYGSTLITLLVDHESKTFRLRYRLNWMGGHGPFTNTIYGNVVHHSDSYISLHSKFCEYDNGNIVKNLESDLYDVENTLVAFRFIKLGVNADIDKYEKDYQNILAGATINGEKGTYNSILVRCKQHNPYYIYEDPIYTMEEELKLHILEHVLMTSNDIPNIYNDVFN